MLLIINVNKISKNISEFFFGYFSTRYTRTEHGHGSVECDVVTMSLKPYWNQVLIRTANSWTSYTRAQRKRPCLSGADLEFDVLQVVGSGKSTEN